jgi:hypothetical protein
MKAKFDEFVKSRNMHNFVIPVKTGIQCSQIVVCFWIPACAGMTDFLRACQISNFYFPISTFRERLQYTTKSPLIRGDLKIIPAQVEKN